MTEKLEKTIKDGLMALPKEMQEAVNSSNWDKISEEIGKKFFLSDDDINILQLEVGLVLLTYRTLDLLAKNIESSVVIDEKSANEIFNELDEKIFIPIEKKLQVLMKEHIKTKNPKWEQSVNFIVSGGDYSVFLDK